MMIPLTVCDAGALENLQGLAITGIVVLMTALFARITRRRHFSIALVGSLLVGFSPPVAAMFGLWPFDDRWRHDCGSTPSMNVAVYYSLLSSVPLALVTSFLARRLAS